MPGSIKNRIAAFENLAEQSKTSSKLLAIVPPKPGFSASKKIATTVKAKETYGFVPFEPLKSKSFNTNNNSVNQSTDEPKEPERKKQELQIDVGVLQKYKNKIRESESTSNEENQPDKSPDERVSNVEVAPKDVKEAVDFRAPEPTSIQDRDVEIAASTRSISPPPPESSIPLDKPSTKHISTAPSSMIRQPKLSLENETLDHPLSTETENNAPAVDAVILQQPEPPLNKELERPNDPYNIAIENEPPVNLDGTHRKPEFSPENGTPDIYGVAIENEASINLDGTHRKPEFPPENDAPDIYGIAIENAINLDGTHRKPEFPPENDTLDIYGIAPKEPEHPLNTESPDFQEHYNEQDDYMDSDDMFPVISVKSNDELHEERDEESISPLSFQGYKISSKREQAPPLTIPAIEEEPATQIVGSGLESNVAQKAALKSKRMDLPDINMEEEEADDVEDHISNDESADLISFGSRTNGGTSASNSFGNTRGNEDVDKLESVQEDYDNFTLGSGESGTFFLSNNSQENEPWHENVQDTIEQEIALSSHIIPQASGHHSTYEHREERREFVEDAGNSKKSTVNLKQMAKPHDPLFIEDDISDDSGSDSKSRKGEQNSFEEYVQNMEPVRSEDQNEKPYDDMENLVENNLNESIDDRALSDGRQNNLSLYAEERVFLSETDLKVLGLEDDASSQDGVQSKPSAKQLQDAIYVLQNDDDLSSSHSLRSDKDETEYSNSDDMPHDTTSGTLLDFSHEASVPSLYSENKADGKESPIFYPEEDFIEDDYVEECYGDEETLDDETGDLLGVNFEELSMASEGQESHFINKQMSKLMLAEISENGEDENLSLDYKPTILKHTNIAEGGRAHDIEDPESSSSTHKPYGVEEQSQVPLPAVHEDMPTGLKEFPVKRQEIKGSATQYDSSGPLLTIRNNISSNNDELSQMTESTYDLEHRLQMLQSSQAGQEQNKSSSQASNSDHKSLMTNSDHKSLMTYSISEHTNATSIVQKASEKTDIFREKNALRDSVRLGTIESAISDLSDPVTGFGRGGSKQSNPSINGGLSQKHNKEKKKTSTRRRSSSPSKRKTSKPENMPHTDSGRGRGRERLPKQKLSSKKQKRKDGTNGSSRRFSFRSLSPFRRRSSSRSNKINEKNSSEFDKGNKNSALLKRPNLSRQKSENSHGSSPSLILAEEELRETSIPLVAVTLSDDSSRKKKQKKKRFSFRSLSPFSRRRRKDSKKGKGVDPFDEGESSI